MKIYIIDNDSVLRRAIKNALEFSLKAEVDDNFPPDADLGKLVNQLVKALETLQNEAVLLLLNANLRLQENDTYYDRRGWDLAKKIRQYPDLKVAIALYSLDEIPKILEKEPKSHWGHLQVLCDTSIVFPQDIPGLSDKCSSAFNSFNKLPRDNRLNLAIRLLDIEIENENKHYRHTFFSEQCLASVRLLLGAMQNGDVDIQTAGEAFSQLYKKNDGIAENGANCLKTKITPLLERRKCLIEKLKELGGSNGKRGTRKENKKNVQDKVPTKTHPQVQRGKLLIVDDELVDAGWKEVYKCIFTSPRFYYQENNVQLEISWEAAKSLITPENQNATPLDFIIMDLHLGATEATGLEALLQIKAQQFDLPVIMVTGFESAQIAKACYKHGAFDYFVKERSEVTDRSSLEYYKKFVEIMERAPVATDSVRVLWKKFRGMEESINTLIADKFTARVRNPSQLIRKAFFVLFVDETNVRTQYLYKNRYKEATDNINEVAMELHRQYLKTKTKGYTTDLTRKLIYGRQFKHHYPGKVLTNDTHISHAKELVHEPQHAVKHVKECTTTGMDALLTIASVYMKEMGIPVQGCSSHTPSNIDTDIVDAIRSLPRKSSTHDHQQRAYEGAEKLLIGYLLERNVPYNKIKAVLDKLRHGPIPERLNSIKTTFSDSSPRVSPKKYTCLYIDDDGEESGWKKFFELVLPDVETKYYEFTDGNTNALVAKMLLENSGGNVFVLLDLFLPDGTGKPPSGDTGLAVLRQIKQANFSLPVIMLTASDDSVWARKCFNAGADDYFPKYGLIMEVEGGEERFYKDCYLNFQKAIKHVTVDLIEKKRVHSYWKIIEDLRSAMNGIMSLYRENTQIHCEVGKKLCGDLDVAKNIYLDNMFFFYTADMDILNYSRLFHLFGGSGEFYKEVFLNYGAVVEHLFKFLYFYENKRAGREIDIDKTVHEIKKALNTQNNNKLRTLVEEGHTIWQKRNGSVRENLEVNESMCRTWLDNTKDFFCSIQKYLKDSMTTKNRQL